MATTIPLRPIVMPTRAARLAPAARALTLGLLLIAMIESCYSYQRVESEPPPRAKVRITFATPRALTLDTMGGQVTIDSVQSVSGAAAGRNGDTLLVTADRVDRTTGRSYFPVGTLVAVSISDSTAQIARRRQTPGTVAASALLVAAGLFPWIAAALHLTIPVNP